MQEITEPKDRLLLGPGPSNVNPRVIRAMTMPLMGYLDPTFLGVMGDVVELLRTAFRTKNDFTLALSGTGTSGMEASLINILEPGDTVVVGLYGILLFIYCLASNAVHAAPSVIPSTSITLQPGVIKFNNVSKLYFSL